jgi:hypothetical protein
VVVQLGDHVLDVHDYIAIVLFGYLIVPLLGSKYAPPPRGMRLEDPLVGVAAGAEAICLGCSGAGAGAGAGALASCSAWFGERALGCV